MITFSIIKPLVTLLENRFRKRVGKQENFNKPSKRENLHRKNEFSFY